MKHIVLDTIPATLKGWTANGQDKTIFPDNYPFLWSTQIHQGEQIECIGYGECICCCDGCWSGKHHCAKPGYCRK